MEDYATSSTWEDNPTSSAYFSHAGISRAQRSLTLPRVERKDFKLTVVEPDGHGNVRTTFKKLQNRLNSETMFLSNPMDRYANIFYLRIIGLGPDVIPILMEELAESRGDWFLALSALTGEDPVRKSQWGKYDAMRDAWLRWWSKRQKS